MSGGALRVEVVCEREHVVWRRAMRMGARRARRGVQACAPVWRDRVEKGGCGEEARRHGGAPFREGRAEEEVWLRFGEGGSGREASAVWRRAMC